VSALREALAAWDEHQRAWAGIVTAREQAEWKLFADHHARCVADAFVIATAGWNREDVARPAALFALTSADGRKWISAAAGRAA
jgi:hypothetical protein